MRAIAILISCVVLASCGARQEPNEIIVQRFFGTCQAQYGSPHRR